MRISDWSSDVCSSDLVHDILSDRSQVRESRRIALHACLPGMEQRNVGPQLAVKPCCLEASFHVLRFFRRKGRKRTYARVPAARLCCAAGLCIQEDEIGRASCRERVCQYVKISG